MKSLNISTPVQMMAPIVRAISSHLSNKQRAPTYSINLKLWHLPSCQIIGLSLITKAQTTTSIQTLSTLHMHSCGGMSNVLHSLVSQEWLLTISAFLIRINDFIMAIFLNSCVTATSVDVEHLFSHGRLLLLHVHSCLSLQSIHVFIVSRHLVQVRPSEGC